MKIKELLLFTNNLENQIEFYSNVLEFPIVEKGSEFCSFKIGESVLTFQFREESTPYHFAFNIPSNQEKEALNWLRSRVSLLSFEHNEIINFESWKAKALYFFDADKNLVEFIARKELNDNATDMFSFKSVLNISEIGIGTSNIEKIYNELNLLKSLAIYDGDFKRFCAVGNAEGLFILANTENKKWFPVNSEIFESDFIINGDFNFKYLEGEISAFN